jgi:UDP-glucose:(heptosyl)LPS alpha-1,3-glucosyltransferase
VRREAGPHVALVAHAIHDQGGMERAFYELIRRAHDRYRFTVIAGELAPELRALVEWRRVPVPRRPAVLAQLAFAVVAGRTLTHTRAELVHTLGAVVPNHVDLSTVQFCHAGYVSTTGRLAPPDVPVVRRLNTSAARVAALVAERRCYRPEHTRLAAAVSEGVAAELARHYPRLPVVITPNGVDVTRFRPRADTREKVRREHAANGDVVALFVGGDWDRKGLGVAIQGLALARGANAARLKLWVVGAGDDRRFRSLAASLGVADGVSFLGKRADTEAFFQAADLFVSPTQYETFSIAAYEAAASELPVVSTPVSGVAELVGDGEAGILVERSAQAVGTALARLAGDEDLRRHMGEAARRKAAAYGWDRSVNSVTEAYDGLLRSGGRQ